ncbi:helix-turn-helix domain-containing protein [Novosphingobium pentaromativorans]|uniref:LuxR family transcriptional regulator n=1 Tax=Novosphingobium pentaromativorans US6-1 TaxID=1088721 RepID=G6EEI9_9SPHN|nr:helix-turn-helix transcriptional regulator [Novosphingobium pentaromativorans]AIT79423.1 LuxR family transcriptional regulator [Novosphingobium pentaromativorans US6-1]EHJ60234.1 LuxR family transcriptional regulator [Novosphingobium pentaromativorans US6-1]
MFDEDEARSLLDSLTAKQVEVLDLLAMHRTTKEIARELNIAPNTVDQRISAVRDKWGTTNRKDTTRRYVELLELCDKTTCDFSRVDDEPGGGDDADQDLPVDPVFVLSDARPLAMHREWYEDKGRRPAGLEAFDAKFGRAGRLVAILVLAMIMAMTLASSLAIADALGRLI